MNLLRILVANPIAADRAAHWSLHGASGVSVRHGYDVPANWPAADRAEIVFAAGQVRLASVALPPLAPSRVAAAAAFALEDQLANPADDPVLAASPQRPDGRVVVAIIGRPLLSSLRRNIAASTVLGRVERAIAEPELSNPGAGWCWCVPADAGEGEGFVRTADGSAFPVSARSADGSLPPELELALAQAARGNGTPAQIRVDATVTDDILAQWQRATGIVFVPGTPWRWFAAPAAAFAAATNTLQGEFAATSPAPPGERVRSFKPAIWIAATALALHVAATIGEWAWWRFDGWRTARALRAVAVSAGVKDADATSSEGARAALARRYAEQRHAQRLAAPGDALPLLARAAPALSSVPPGTIKSANYADGHWTLDLQRTNPATVRDVDARLKRAGLTPITIATAGGARIRFGTD